MKIPVTTTLLITISLIIAHYSPNNIPKPKRQITYWFVVGEDQNINNPNNWSIEPEPNKNKAEPKPMCHFLIK